MITVFFQERYHLRYMQNLSAYKFRPNATRGVFEKAFQYFSFKTFYIYLHYINLDNSRIHKNIFQWLYFNHYSIISCFSIT